MGAHTTINHKANNLSLIRSEIRVGISDAPPALLAPGRVLNVEVARLGDQSGIVIQGRFIPARIPTAALDGQKLQVQVQSSSDALVLKILHQAPQGERLLSQSIKDLISQLLPEINLTQLRNAFGTQDAKIPEALIARLFGKPGATQAAHNSPISPQLLNVIEDAIQSGTLLHDSQLQNSKVLEQFLSKNVGSITFRNIQESIDALKRLEQSSPAAQQVRMLQVIEATLTAISNQTEPLSFKSESNPEILAHQLRLYLLASHSALQTQDTATLNKINQDLGALKRLENPLVLLARVLGMWDIGTGEPTSFGGKATEFVQQLLHALKDAEQKSTPDQDLRQIAKKFAASARGLLESHKDQAAQTPLLQTTQEALKSLERVMQGQQTLNQLNPVMQALGEPLLFFLPVLTGSVVSKWELVTHKELVKNEKEEQKKGAAEGYQKVSLHLQLPSIGPSEVHIAHRTHEILLHITVENEAAATYLNSQFKKLGDIFTTLGYTKVQTNIKAGQIKKVTPSWFNDLGTKSLIA